jgi:hypothetical protein
VEETIRIMRRQGASLSEIAYALRELGAPAPAGGAWTKKAVERILGTVPGRGGEVPRGRAPQPS